MNISEIFISIGGNRNPAAADWDTKGLQLLAFGADNSIALWNPLDHGLRGVRSLLNGHNKAVNAVKFFPTEISSKSILLSGSADHTLRIWRCHGYPEIIYEAVKTITEHQSPIIRIATLPASDIFATGASDGTVKIWRLLHDADFSNINAELLQTIILSPKFFPLNIALEFLDDSSLILAVAGTRSTIQIFLSRDTHFDLVATLSGHEGWIRALEFTRERKGNRESDLLLASASQDKYIRLWRVHTGEELPAVSSALNDPALGILGKSLSNKAHRIESKDARYSITFEALLLGHEDWIYTASWRHREGKLQLLSTSEDNSLAIWESDPNSGVWVCVTRLGEISAQKGSTTATGSAGGFWIGLWSPDANTIVSLGRTGSWRKWTYSSSEHVWVQQVAITGHIREVKGLCWSKDGSYLLSTSSDQTTRLFTEWKRENRSSWHELSRPQIHGYDLNCIDSVTDTQFISGADEKLLRVFDEPKGVADILNKLCHIQTTSKGFIDAANIPVLGLSNKAIQAVEDYEPASVTDEDEREAVDPASFIRKSTLDFDHPPFEDHLARHLLWPETEKLYGHGYEISAVATSNDGTLVATACRASAIDHAVVRIYDTKEWLEVKPPLKAHSLTVTALQFSHDDQYLLSVGRDRQWAVWKRGTNSTYSLALSNPKGHTRMILDTSWAPIEHTFLTAGRDKSVKIWQFSGSEAQLKTTISATSAVTAVACIQHVIQDQFVFAYGTDGGEISICSGLPTALEQVQVSKVDTKLNPARSINRIAWRPNMENEKQQLGVASDDNSVRVFEVSLVHMIRA
ncbi:RNA polymeras-like protein II Elongator subunit [Lindgomyces ingoldianus]|uniref:RNA polymeras-like protein II Elongator subunit n=1 Tax=Lindgomyces ingoldianus TaxID=673940 RepID=A0ACB6R9F0_9PLEO|nr:RNA polymeras-like protein II Elongator subunit [Lindgomyces ingoldianus]KAF2475152.1 RNA polymeras-like protein II Elongator subunit [Lindgomyces ingoldianus]